MNSRWYVSTFIIILAIFGLSQEQTKVANQKIVIQFTDVELTSVDAHDKALATITKKLQALGAASIKIIENDDSKLSIHYYSSIDVLSIKELLSQERSLPLTDKNLEDLPFKFPKEQLPENYSLVVSDLQQQGDDVLRLNGKFAFEVKQTLKRFYNPVVFQTNNSIAVKQDLIIEISYKAHNVTAIAIKNTLQEIPEVRAGPCYI